MRACLALVLVAACGSKPTRPAAPPPFAPPPPPPPAVATCVDAGVILRGDVHGEDEDAGPAKEQTVARACEEDAWPQSVIDCIASTPHPQDCLERLDDKRRLGYEKRLQAWSDEFSEGDGLFSGAAVASPIACEDMIGSGEGFRSSATVTPWAEKQRRDVLVEECEHHWSDSVKRCVEAAAAPGPAWSCLKDELAQNEVDELAQQLTEIDRLADQIEKLKKKPAAITCKKVVEAHYGDARWKQKLDGFKPADRKRMISASRDLMTKACTVDTWDDTQRACIVVDGGDYCFEGSAKRRWGFPATGTVTSVGIAECDDYSAEVTKLTRCRNLPASARDSIVRSQQQTLAEIARVPASERARMGSSCKAAMDAIAASLENAGC